MQYQNKNTQLKLIDIFKRLLKVKDLGGEADFRTAVDIGPAGKLPVQPENDLETGRLIGVIKRIANVPPSIEITKGSILDENLQKGR